jgi:CubicO group peptidase (beta-lactamase class C family)
VTEPVKTRGIFGLFEYSSAGFAVLQQMVEDIEGRSYSDVLMQRVLRPLGMVASTFDQPPSTDRLAFGHSRSGKPIPGGFRIFPEMAAGGMWTTPHDIAKLALAIINSVNGEPGSFLSKEQGIEMVTPIASDYALGLFIDVRGRFNHPGGTPGFRASMIGDAKNRSGIAVLTNGDNGEIVSAALYQWAAKAFRW